VPDDHFLVLGDNRANSWDGRYWPGSRFLHKNEIIGKAYLRFWPLDNLSFFKERFVDFKLLKCARRS